MVDVQSYFGVGCLLALVDGRTFAGTGTSIYILLQEEHSYEDLNSDREFG